MFFYVKIYTEKILRVLVILMKKNEISVLNVLFCMMVIFIHVTAAPLTSHNTTENVSKILFFFHRMSGVAVHGFIFLSGLKLFIKDTDKINYPKYLVSRFKRVYVPYLIFAVLYYVFEVSRNIYVFDLKQLGKFLLIGSGEAHFYFVFVIMQFYILFPIWRKLLKTKNITLLLCISLLINFICYSHIPKILSTLNISNNFTYNHGLFTSYIFAWILGCVCGKYYEEFLAIAKRKMPTYGLLTLILLMADVIMAYNFTFNGATYFCMSYIRLLYLYSMIMFLYGFFANYSFRIFRTDLFKMIDRATFSIYLFHVFVIYAVDSFTKAVFPVGQLKMYVINFILVYSISVTLCVLFGNYLRRSKNEKN